MAFYADIFGYVTVKKGFVIPQDLVNELSINAPMFSLCFSSPIDSGSGDRVSFACRKKIDSSENELWLSPFEEMLKRSDFLNASVVFIHEESVNVMMFTYVRQEKIVKIESTLSEEVVKQIIIE